MGILITIIALGIVVFFHELGHLIVARRSGIGVSEFAVGMGPKVFSKKINGILWSIRLLPIGGFVSVAGLNDEQISDDDPKSYYSKPFFPRLLTLAAGSFMNLLTGFMIFWLVFGMTGKPVTSSTIQYVAPNTPAAEAGLLAHDVILSVDGLPTNGSATALVRHIQTSSKPVVLEILSNGQKKSVTVTPTHPQSGRPYIGVQFDAYQMPTTLLSSAKAAGEQTVFISKMVFVSLKMLVSKEAHFKDLAGPVGIIQLATAGLEKGIFAFLSVIAMISISLGIANLLPIPALDGGHIALLCVEKVRGKRLSPVWENRIQTAGFVLLIGLMAVILVNDILQWPSRILLFKGK